MHRGIKSFELRNGGNRWYIAEVYWDWERPDNAIPAPIFWSVSARRFP